MTRMPNRLQRLVQRFVALPRVTRFFSHIVHKADGPVLRWSGGRYSFSRWLAGFPTIYVTMTGARSGQARSLPLNGLPENGRFVLVASNLGRSSHPGWYFNMKKHPDVLVLKDGETRRFRARETDGQERERYWEMALDWYPGYDVYRLTAGTRSIPVMVLEPQEQA